MYWRLLMIAGVRKVLVRIGNQRLVHVQGDRVGALDVGPVDAAVRQEDGPGRPTASAITSSEPHRLGTPST